MSYKDNKTWRTKKKANHSTFNSAQGLRESSMERVLTPIPRKVLHILGVLGLSWFKGFWSVSRPATLALTGGKK